MLVSMLKETCLLKCSTGCTEGDIHLVGGSNIYEGRVEVCHNQIWGTVCYNGWDNNDGFVACTQLGLPPLLANASVYFEQGTGLGLCDNEKTYISIISITKTHFITINDIISIMNIVF